MACCYLEDCGEYAVTPMLVSPCMPTKCCEEPRVCYPCLPSCDKPQIVYCCAKKSKPQSPPLCCEHHDHGGDCSERYCYAPRQQKSRQAPHQNSSRSNSPDHCPTCCRPIKTKYVMPCYRYEDGRVVKKLPVSAFKRNGMQDQEHSKLLGTTNFLVRHPQDVAIECDVCTTHVKKADPAKVPREEKTPLGCRLLKKKPIEINQPTLLMRRACEVAVGVRERRKPFVMSTFKADADHVEQRYHSEDERGNCCYHFERQKHTSPSCCTMPHGNPHCHPSPCHASVSCPECQYQDCVYSRTAVPKDNSCCYYC